MSSPQTKTENQIDRIKTNCNLIWGTGDECDYDLELRNTNEYYDEIDDGDKSAECYQVIVRKDYGHALGPKLVVTDVYEKAEEAWEALDEELVEMVVGIQLRQKSEEADSGEQTKRIEVQVGADVCKLLITISDNNFWA